MTRMIVMSIVMAFAIGFVGCRSCMAPYDLCQPTFIPERGDQCMGELYRCGSVLGGMNRLSTPYGGGEDCGEGSIEYYNEDGTTTTAPYVEPMPMPMTTGEFSLADDYYENY